MERKHLVILAVAVLVCVTVILAARDTAGATGSQRRVQWEYGVYRSRAGYALPRGSYVDKLDSLGPQMDSLGEQGWELVSVIESQGNWTYWLKRPK